MVNVLIIGHGYLGGYLHEKYDWNILKSECVWQQDLKDYDVFVYTTWVTNVDKWENDFQNCLSTSMEPLGHLIETYPDKQVIFISSAFVFDGEKVMKCINQPVNYKETDCENPINNYGRGKLYCERFVESESDNHIIIRVDDTYGPGKMYRYAMAPTDRYSTPTYVDDLASLINAMISRENVRGIFHLGGNTSISRYDFIKQYHSSCRPCLISELNLSARRPRMSSLNNKKIYDMFNIKPTPMKQAIQRCLEEEKENG